MTLRPNGHGGYIVRQSDLSSWSRCQMQKHYIDRAKEDPDAPQPESLSATEYGNVVHYALMLYERLRHEGREDAADVAVATFEKYWHPANIGQIAHPVTTWLPRQTYGGLRDRGRQVIRDYAKLATRDDARVLALEYRFAVPIVVGDTTHTLSGTVDRLAMKAYYSQPYLSLDDHKTGKQSTYLRWNVQGSAYAYATTQPEFWTGWDDSGVQDEFETFDQDTTDALNRYLEARDYALFHNDATPERPLASRRFRWVNMQEVKFVDGGWRSLRDYQRLRLAIDAYVRANEAGIYSITTTGEICRFCPFNKTCGGLGIPDEDEGAPKRRK